jgi:Phospholipase_D-nuclease N-terminal
VILPVILALVALWAWVLVEAIRVPDDAEYRAGTKLVWVLVIAITGLIGAAVYLAVGRPTRRPAPQ